MYSSSSRSSNQVPSSQPSAASSSVVSCSSLVPPMYAKRCCRRCSLWNSICWDTRNRKTYRESRFCFRDLCRLVAKTKQSRRRGRQATQKLYISILGGRVCGYCFFSLLAVHFICHLHLERIVLCFIHSVVLAAQNRTGAVSLWQTGTKNRSYTITTLHTDNYEWAHGSQFIVYNGI